MVSKVENDTKGRDNEMELIRVLLIVAVVALLGAMAQTYGVDSRPNLKRGEANEWI